MALTMASYPVLTADYPERPNRLWAVLFFGIFVKLLILIPVFIELMVLGWVLGLLLVINSFVVLFTGTYWAPAYSLALGVMRLSLKMGFYLAGLTDRYPGFDLTIQDHFELDIPRPMAPNRIFAIPVVGAVIRYVLLIPYLLWLYLVSTGTDVGVLGAAFTTFFAGRYPTSVFELVRDLARLQFATTCYFLGLEDHYPSFAISWNQRNIKIGLLIAGAVLALLNTSSSLGRNANQAPSPPPPASSAAPRV